MPSPLRCILELSFHLQRSTLCKMEQIYFAIFGLSSTPRPLHHYVQKTTIIAKRLIIDGCKPRSVNVVSIVFIRLTYWCVCECVYHLLLRYIVGITGVLKVFVLDCPLWLQFLGVSYNLFPEIQQCLLIPFKS